MIRYSCDLCKRELDCSRDLRYVVKVEITAAIDPAPCDEPEDDRDYLQEIQDILEALEATDEGEVAEEVFQQVRLDLCPECRKTFLKKLLRRETAKLMDFSEN